MRMLFSFLILAHGWAAARIHVNYSTFLGGSLDETAAAVAVDSAGSAYIAGLTTSPDFPLTSTAFGTPSKDHGCAFVTKLNANGSGIVWSVCLADSAAEAIALDGGGNVYVLTNNTVITKLAPGGDRVLYSQQLSGASPVSIAVDSAGNVYAAGGAGPGLATTTGAYQATPAPGMCTTSTFLLASQTPCADAFAMKLRPDGSLAYATYLGGSVQDHARAIAIDGHGNAWITGETVSPDFPVTPDALEPRFHGAIDLGPLQYGDGFLAKLDPSGGKLLYSTYLGGTGVDAGLAVAVDGAGAVYVGGATQSADFLTTSGAFQRTYGGGPASPSLAGDAFLVKFTAAGALVYSTYLGGPQPESANEIVVDPGGNTYLTGYAGSVSELSADGSAIVNSAPLSGWFALDAKGALYVTGTTPGSMFFPSAGSLQPAFGGGTYDVTVVKVDFGQPASPWISSIVNAAGMRTGTPSFYPVFDVAPGEIISIFGSSFDSGTKLLFDGIPAPVLYVQDNQINAVVPFGVTGPITKMTLQGAGQSFGPGTMNVFSAVPALFTVDGSGKGQAAVLNQDGSVNSTLNAAPRGSTISVFLTGAGRMRTAQPDGWLGPLAPPFPAPVLGAGCSLGTVVFAGAAPGLVAGAVQVNVLLSQDLTPGGQVPIVIYIGNYASGFLGDTTIAVR